MDIMDLFMEGDEKKRNYVKSNNNDMIRLFKKDKIIGFIYDVDYIIKNNITYLRCFFITDNGEIRIILIKDYYPYFYVDLNDVENMDIMEDIFNYITGLSGIVEINEVERYSDTFREKRKLLKISVKTPKIVPDMRTKIMQYSRVKLKDNMYQVKIYEATIPYHQRVMIDLDVPIYKHIEISGELYDFYEFTNVLIINANDFNKSYRVISDDKLPNFRYMIVDIEVYNPYVSVRDDRDLIIIIGVGYGIYGKTFKYRQFNIDNYYGLSMFEQEELMLDDFNKFVEDWKPDLIVGHNSDIFDLPFIINRMKLHGIKPIWGKDFSIPYYKDSEYRKKEEIDDIEDIDLVSLINKIKNEISVSSSDTIIDDYTEELILDEEVVKKRSKGFRVVSKGVIIFDTYKVVLSLYPKAPAKLKELPEYFKLRKHEERKYVDGSKIYEYWDNLETREMLKEYNIDDVRDTYLVMKVLFEQFFSLARYIGMNINDMVGKKYGALNRFYYRKMLYKKEAISFDYYKLENEEENEKKKFKGAFVFKPKVGFYRNVVVSDFKSLYPSIIISYNISPENLYFEEDIVEKKFLGDVNLTGIKKYYIKTRSGEEGEAIFITFKREILNKDKKVIGEEIVKYYYLQRDSVFTSILKGIITERFRYKKLYKEEKNEELKMKYYNEQYVRKILMNSLYGIMGSKFSGYYHKEVAETITFLGKLHLLSVGELSRSFNLSIIYGDTDSLFLHYSNKNDLSETIEKINEFIFYVNRNLPVELDIDKIFVKFAISTEKKKYYGLIKEGDKLSPYIAGYKLVKRNVPIIATEMQFELINYILNNFDIDYFNKDAIRNIVSKYISKLENYEIKKEDISMSVRLSKSIRDYEVGKVAHVEAIRHAIYEHKFQYIIGEYYSFIIISKDKIFKYLKNTISKMKDINFDLVSSRAILVEFLDDIRDIDVSYYKELLIISLEEVLKPFGMKYENLFVEEFNIF